MAFGIFFANQVSASSNTLNFQSKIVNVADGTNVVSGTPSCVVAGSGNDTCDFRVRIYDASSAGTLLFSETHSNVEIGQYNGIFNLLINSVCASTSTAGTDGNWTSGGCISNGGVNFSASSLWIEVGFDPAGGASFTETFSRVQIKDVASARYAVSASYLGGIAAADFVQFKPGATQTTSSTNSLINLETTGNTSNPLIYVDEDGAGTPDLLRLQTNDITMFQVGNGGAVTMVGDLINTSTGTIGLFNTNVTTLNIGGATTTLNLAGGSAANGCTINTSGDIACTGSGTFGTTSSPQLKVQYDLSNYFTSVVASDGTVTFDSSSAGLYDVFSFSDSVEIDKDFSTSDPIALRVVSTSASTSSGGSVGSVLLRTTRTGSNASGSLVGLYSEANFNNTGAGSLSSVVGISSRPTGGLGLGGVNSSVTTLVGFESNPLWNSTGTVTNVIGLRANPQNATNGTRTNEYGIYVGSIVNAANTYGLYIEGAGTYALWTDAGDNRFDGNLVTGSTSLDVFNTTATTLNIGGAATTLNLGISGASGSLALMGGSGSTGCTIDGTNGNLACSGTISGSFSVADDSLDYNKFEDTMDLDANLILNQGAFTWVQDFTGTTTVGQTYNTTSLTTGTGLRMVAGAGLLANGELLDLDLGTSTAGNALNINTNAANYAGTGLINITSASSTAGTGILLTMTGSTSGAGVSITNTATYTGTLGLIRVSSTGITSGTGLSITSGNTLTTSGELIDLNMGASTAGNGLNVTTTGAYTGTGLVVLTANSAQTGTIASINGNALTSGVGLSITGTGTGVTTGSMLRVSTGTTGAVATNGIVSITATGNYSSTSNAGLLNVTANATTAGTVQSIFADALTTGTALNISSTSAALTGNLQTISLSGNNAANTGDLLELIISGGSNVARGLFVNNAGIGASIDVSQTSTPGAANVNSIGLTSTILGTSSGTHRALSVLSIGAPTVGLTQTGLFGGTIQGANNGAGTITTGYALTTLYSNNSTGTVSGANGVFAQVANTSTGTITGAIGVQIASAVNSGGGTFTTNYGMRIDSQTAGATDYGLYITGADTYSLVVASGNTYLGTGLVTHAFGGTTTTAHSITANSVTSGKALQISTSTTGASGWDLLSLSSTGANASGTLIDLTVSDATSLAIPLTISNAGTNPSISVEHSGFNILTVSGNTVNIGSSSLTERLSVMRTYGGAQAFATSIFHDGNNANADVLLLQGGLDDGTRTTIYLQARDGNGDNVGRIVNAAGTFSLADQSDRRTKTNIINTSIEGLSVLNALRVVDYNRIQDPNGPTIHGFIAQEVQEVYPFAVIEPDDQGMLSLSKELMIPMIVKATQELNEKVDSNYQELSPLSSLRIDVDDLNLRLNNTIGILDTQKLRIDALESTVAGLQNTISNFQGYTLPSTASFTELVLTGVLKVEGQLLLSNKNIGTSTVTAGQTEVAITFATVFPQTPVVVASPIDSFVGYTVKEITQTGFKIAIESAAAVDIQFNWFVSSNLP